MTFRFIATTFRLSSIHALDAKSLVKTFSAHPGTSSSAGAQKFTSGCCTWYRSFRPFEARLSTCLRRFGGLLKAGTLTAPGLEPAPRVSKNSFSACS